MPNIYLILTTTTVVRARTHIDQTPIEKLIGLLPIILLIIGIFVIVIYILRTEVKESKALKAFDISDSVRANMLYNMLAETQEYYKSNRRQMTIIFACAIISCFVGLTVLLFSAFYFVDEAKTMGAISGTVTSFISGAFFWIYKQCYEQVQKYFNTLTRLQNIFIAMEMIEECDNEIKNEKMKDVIDALINMPNGIKTNTAN